MLLRVLLVALLAFIGTAKKNVPNLEPHPIQENRQTGLTVYTHLSCEILYGIYTVDHYAYAHLQVSLLLQYGASPECVAVINGNRDKTFTYHSNSLVQVHDLLTEIDCEDTECSDHACVLGLLASGLTRKSVAHAVLFQDIYLPGNDIVAYFEYGAMQLDMHGSVGVVSALPSGFNTGSDMTEIQDGFVRGAWMAKTALLEDIQKELATRCDEDNALKWDDYVAQYLKANHKKIQSPLEARVWDLTSTQKPNLFPKWPPTYIHLDDIVRWNARKHDIKHIERVDHCHTLYILHASRYFSITRTQISLLAEQGISQDCIKVLNTASADIFHAPMHPVVEVTSVCTSHVDDPCGLAECLLTHVLEYAQKTNFAESVYLLEDDQLLSPDFSSFVQFSHLAMKMDKRIVSATAQLQLPTTELFTAGEKGSEFFLSQIFPQGSGFLTTFATIKTLQKSLKNQNKCDVPWQILLDEASSSNEEEQFHLYTTIPRSASMQRPTEVLLMRDSLKEYPSVDLVAESACDNIVKSFIHKHCGNSALLKVCNNCVSSEKGHADWWVGVYGMLDEVPPRITRDMLLPLYKGVVFFRNPRKQSQASLLLSKESPFYSSWKSCTVEQDTGVPEEPSVSLPLFQVPSIWPRPVYDSRIDEAEFSTISTTGYFQLDKLASSLLVVDFSEAVERTLQESRDTVKIQTEKMVQDFITQLQNAEFGAYTRTANDLNEFDGPELTTFEIKYTQPLDKLFDAPFGENEAYKLSITSSVIYVEAASVAAVARALSTLQFMSVGVSMSSSTATTQLNVMAVPGLPAVIEDAPEYPYRSFMIDTGRAYLPVDTIYQTIDALSLLKYNILHWHMTDDQSFPIEIKSYPKLYEVGAYWLGFIHNMDKPGAGAKTPTGTYYKQSEIKGLVEYAKLKGVRLVPEIDMPGHSYSWGKAYPELSVECPRRFKEMQARTKTNYLINMPLNIAHELSYTIAGAVIREIADLFDDPFFVLGADEVKPDCWNEAKIPKKALNLETFITRIYTEVFLNQPKNIDEMQRAAMRDTLEYYGQGEDENMRRMLLSEQQDRKPLAEDQDLSEKTLVFWERVPIRTIPKDKAIVLMWQTDNQITEAVRGGYRAVRCKDYYLDYERKNNPCCTWFGQYEYDPRKGFENNQDIAQGVIGGCAPAWELTYEHSWSYEGPKQQYWYRGFEKVWMRVVATGESWWTHPKYKPKSQTRELTVRMYHAVKVLKRFGIDLAPWCHEEDKSIRMREYWCYDIDK